MDKNIPTHCDCCGCEKDAEELDWVSYHPELAEVNGPDDAHGYICFECN